MDEFFRFFIDHVWMPIMGVLWWLWKDRETKRDEAMNAVNQKIEKMQDHIDNKLVHTSTFEKFVKDLEYVRNGVDDIKDYLLKEKK